MKSLIKQLLHEYFLNKKYLLESLTDCDCCKYFDFNMLNDRYLGYSNPIYSQINKGVEETLVFISPDEYLQLCAKNAKMPYEKYMSIVSSEKYREYSERMKRGEKAPIGFYTINEANQEGRHRALAAKELGCKKIPVIRRRKLSQKDIIEMVEDYEGISREELNNLHKNWGYTGITDLDWKALQEFIKYHLLKEALIREGLVKKQYIGQCDLLRRKCDSNEEYWHNMMKNKERILFSDFINKVDMTQMIDADETPEQYIKDAVKSDFETAAYTSNWGNKECMFLQTAGFEFIFV